MSWPVRWAGALPRELRFVAIAASTRPVGPNTIYYIRGANNELLTEWTNPTATPPTFRDYIYIYAGSKMIAVVEQR